MELVQEIAGWVVRHQSLVFEWVGVIAGGLAAVFPAPPIARRLWDRVRSAAWVSRVEFKWIEKTVPLLSHIVVVVFVVSGFLVAIAVGWVVGSAVGGKQPIPKGIGLTFPDPHCERNSGKLVLFLHGWRGDRHSTWKRFPDLVCEDPAFTDATVLSLNYPVYVFDRTFPIDELADWLNGRLVANGVSRYQKIVIIAHSMGGLVARRMLLQRRPELKGIVLVIEIAVPHLGPNDLVQFLEDLGLKDLSGSTVIEQMRPGSDFLRLTRSDWQGLLPKPDVHCFTSSPLDRVVDFDSATVDCKYFGVIAANGHIDIVKPADPRDDRYSIPMSVAKSYLSQP